MVNAMVLTRFAVGKEKQAIEQIKKIPGVNEVKTVFGAWDAVIIVEADGLKELADVVVDRIRSADGVVGTETLVEIGIG